MKALVPGIAAALITAGLAGPAFAAQDEMDAQSQRVIGGVIDSLIGNRYAVGDRQAVRRCAMAAVDRAERQNRGQFHTLPVAYPGYRGHVRVTDITDVQRRLLVLRVKGLMTTARYGYRNGRRGSDLRFTCDVANNGRIQSLDIDRNPYWRR